MARRKKYKNGEMEHEFSLFCLYHKIMTIQIVLIKFKDEGIFDHYMLKKYNDIEGSCEDKAQAISELLEEQYNNGEEHELNALYDFCWDKLCPMIEDTLNYTEGLKSTTPF